MPRARSPRRGTPSGQVGDQLRDRLADAGVERHLLADVPPGGRVSIPVTVTAPSGAIPLVLEAEMVQEEVAWIDAWSALATGS